MNTPPRDWRILDVISEEYDALKKDADRPTENDFDYFGEGYMAALRRYVYSSNPTPSPPSAPVTEAWAVYGPRGDLLIANAREDEAWANYRYVYNAMSCQVTELKERGYQCKPISITTKGE